MYDRGAGFISTMAVRQGSRHRERGYRRRILTARRGNPGILQNMQYTVTCVERYQRLSFQCHECVFPKGRAVAFLFMRLSMKSPETLSALRKKGGKHNEMDKK